MAEWVLDDIMSNEAADNARSGSFTEIEKIKRWMNRLEPLCDGPGTPITLVGTPWWTGDCYDYAEDLWGNGEDPRFFNWRVRLPDGQTLHFELTLQGELATFRMPLFKDGQNTFPEKWPEHRWMPIQRNDPELFAANMMLEPSSEAVRDFKDGWLRKYDWTIPGRQLRYRQRDGQLRHVTVAELDTIMAVDPAISESTRADRSGLVVTGSLDGLHHIVLEAHAERLSVLDLVKTIEELQRRYRCRRIYVESVAYQKALAQLLRHKNLPVIEYKPGTQKTKEMRIRALEPYFRAGHIYIHDSFVEFQNEYRQFPRGRFDDLLDAMSFLSEEWSRIIGRDDRSHDRRALAEKDRIERVRRWADGPRRPNPRAGSRVGTPPWSRRLAD